MKIYVDVIKECLISYVISDFLVKGGVEGVVSMVGVIGVGVIGVGVIGVGVIEVGVIGVGVVVV